MSEDQDGGEPTPFPKDGIFSDMIVAVSHDGGSPILVDGPTELIAALECADALCYGLEDGGFETPDSPGLYRVTWRFWSHHIHTPDCNEWENGYSLIEAVPLWQPEVEQYE